MRTSVLFLFLLCLWLHAHKVCAAPPIFITGDTMRYAGTVNAPDFPADMEWLNTDRPLPIRELRGKVVLLDFWTYCCINCMHILPDLKKLEEKYAAELVVIGVHSAKFTTERGTDNIREAILRYDIDHPVVNDREFRMWSQYGVKAWPTLMLIDPAGKVIGSLSGEGVYEPLDKVIAEVIAQFDALGKIDRTPLELTREHTRRASSLLAYPGKIITDDTGGRLFFTDSNHNRIIVCTPSGEVLRVVGSGEEGSADGAFGQASFFRPQGLAYDNTNEILYVADTENHLIRKVDFRSGVVQTIAGTGEQARRYNEEGRGRDVALNSPWDLVLVSDVLYIAMAGPHQLWTLDLATLDAKVYAGSGREDLIDGALKAAALAQPSGMTTDGSVLYFADSEVSAVRAAELAPGGSVRTLIGEGLFEFGDVDGGYPAARLQHPLGVAWHDGYVYVADTYNHKIRRIDPVKRTVRTVVGTGKKGYRDGDALSAQLFEPSGLAITGDTMYITDTNNGLIRVVDMATWTVGTMQLTGIDKLRTATASAREGGREQLPEIRISPNAHQISVVLELPDGTKFNPQAPFSFVARLQDEDVVRTSASDFAEPARKISLPVDARAGATVVEIDLSVYYCDKDSEALCYFRDIAVSIPVVVDKGGDAEPAVAIRVWPAE